MTGLPGNQQGSWIQARAACAGHLAGRSAAHRTGNGGANWDRNEYSFSWRFVWFDISRDDRPSFRGRTVDGAYSDDADDADVLGLIDSESEKRERTPRTMCRAMPEMTGMRHRCCFAISATAGKTEGDLVRNQALRQIVNGANDL
ncbi:MAG: hypothetical protein GY734_04105 [Herbaspirillum sp.]|uniref:hypothetical protein n=1 Tax=Herbaspirillum sp. TaxID=1890675 RepID=UPI002587CC29|nr:hypothetical protein [Herbaspirillum sp.]MCP3656537.1 hypothetical protein [Herbaspirillum sp.]MCP3949404.1 hypothetical protein [Herbaspirillum sp.]MCP4030411.1 hypothetical protein [Herbaspirillum sp.]MCP4556854.1 hypothetical protein [Herbaspirillum sp.]